VGEDAEAAAVAGGLVDRAEFGLAEGGCCGGDVWAGFGCCGRVDQAGVVGIGVCLEFAFYDCCGVIDLYFT
jgi:hypothetical protein